MDDDADLFRARFDRFKQLTELGRWADAEDVWHALDRWAVTGRELFIVPVTAEEAYARAQFWQGA